MKISEILQLFFDATDIPICSFHEHALITAYNHKIQDFNLPLILASSMPKHLPGAWYSFTPEYLYFCGCYLEKEDLNLFLGPVVLSECTQKQAQLICDRLGRPAKDSLLLQSCLNQSHLHSVPNFLANLRLLGRLLNLDLMDEIPLVPFTWNIPYPIKTYTETFALSVDNSQPLEEQLLSCVRAGNLTELSRIMNENVLFSDSLTVPSLTDARSFMLGANMLASRAAIDAGVDYVLANRICTHYIRQILQSRSIQELSYLIFSLFQDYTRRVADLDKLPSSSLTVRKVHQYIQLHYDEKVTSQILADHLHLNCSYLCKLFKKETGSTLTDYIQKEKIREARRLLEGSSFTIAEISEALAFSSESYFCKIFKKITGTTPESYRNNRKTVLTI